MNLVIELRNHRVASLPVSRIPWIDCPATRVDVQYSDASHRVNHTVLLSPALLHLLICSSQRTSTLEAELVYWHVILSRTRVGLIICGDISNSLDRSSVEKLTIFKH